MIKMKMDRMMERVNTIHRTIHWNEFRIYPSEEENLLIALLRKGSSLCVHKQFAAIVFLRMKGRVI